MLNLQCTGGVLLFSLFLTLPGETLFTLTMLASCYAEIIGNYLTAHMGSEESCELIWDVALKVFHFLLASS